MYNFPEHKFPFWKGYQESFKIKDFILPHKWINEHFRLSTAYAVQGRITLFKWQEIPVDAIIYFNTVIFIAPVQTGKSMLSEAVTAYKIDNDATNMMIIYAKKDTVEDVFDERLRPLIKEIPAINKYWSGIEDDLTKKKLKLNNCIIRVASAGLKTEIATHNAGFVYGSELAKWPKKDFSQTKAIQGRGQASRMMGKKVKTLYETSPDNDEDPAYVEAHRPGTVIFKPHYPCPHCDHYQVLVDSQIKEKPNKKGEYDRNPERIMQENAAYYECENCKNEITEDERIVMAQKVKWLTENKKIPFEKMIQMKNRPERAVFQWNRLVDTTWTFKECLVAFFTALKSSNPNDLKTYRNEDMAEWIKLTARRYSENWLLSKCGKYTQYGSDSYIPDKVSILLIGSDVQDNGFYYIIRGFGKDLEQWLIRADFVLCDMKEDKYKNPAEVNDTLIKEIYRYPLQKKDGKKIQIYGGIIDRGGHRAGDVDYIRNHNPYIDAYIGSTRKDSPLIEMKKGIYFGNTERLSVLVHKNIDSNIWHLPKDIQLEYCTHLRNQYYEEIIDARGNKKKRLVNGDVTGQPDHYHDCENMLAGLVIALELQTMFFQEDKVANIEKAQVITDEEKPKEDDNLLTGFNKEMAKEGW